MAIDSPIGVDVFVVVGGVCVCVFGIGVCVFWHKCVGVFFGIGVCVLVGGVVGGLLVPKYLKCLGTSGFIFPLITKISMIFPLVSCCSCVNNPSSS